MQRIPTDSLELIPNTLADVRALIEGMDEATRAQLSNDWLALVASPHADTWTLGFTLKHRLTGAIVGTCGFKGPPSENGVVEIAYGLAPEYQGLGYATEAARALTAHAFQSAEVRVVRAHTLADSNASARVLTKCAFERIGQVMDPDDGLVWRWERIRV